MLKIVLLLLTILLEPMPQSQDKTVTLTIEISGLRNSKGNLLVQLTDGVGKKVASQKAKVNNRHATFCFTKLAAGTYAIRYFHDANENGRLDTNWMGMPTEDYGFSNNAKALFGAPPMSERIFSVTRDTTVTLTIG
ncbi:MAG TPA: DUF2141 domain-containing protein [Williamwhitmania sp.]|nr:DUF2141 domain-containing protein [Williamwhitmania sp.]